MRRAELSQNNEPHSSSLVTYLGICTGFDHAPGCPAGWGHTANYKRLDVPVRDPDTLTGCRTRTRVLDQPAADVHDVLVRRVIAFLLVVAVMCLPVLHAGAAKRDTSGPTPAGNMHSQRAPQTADSAPAMMAGTAGTSQTWLAHDALTLDAFSPGLQDYSLSCPFPIDRLRLHISPPFRTSPLLI